MARDVRRYGDAQLDYWLSQPGLSPETRAELEAEKQRRANPAPTNVDANLEAAATPIKTEPVAGYPQAPAPQSYEDYAEQSDLYQRGIGLPPQDGYESDAEVEARFDAKFGRGAYKRHKKDTRVRDHGRAYRASIKAEQDARDAENQAARRAGYQDPEQIAYNEATGVVYDRPAAGPMQGPSPMNPDDPSTWEAGYQDYVQRNTPAEPTNSVERVDRYFADKKRPPLQSKEDFMADQSQAYTRRQAAKNQEQYGYGLPADEVTADQKQRRGELIDRENSQRATQVDLVIGRLAAQYGAPNAEVAAALKPFLEDGSLTPQEISQATSGFRYAHRDKQNAELADRRAFLRRRGMLAGSNLRANAANNWTDMPADWQNFVRAGGKGATPLDVQGRQLEQAAVLARNAVAGALAGNVGGGLQWQQWEAMQRGKAVERARQLAEAKGGKLTVADRGRIAAQVDAEFPGHGQAAADALDVQEPLPLPEGHGNPGRMPDGTYPMM